MEIDALIDEALSDEDYVLTVESEYFTDPSHALVHLFCALLDIFNVENPELPADVLAEVYSEYLDDSYDPELEGYRVRCVNRLFNRINDVGGLSSLMAQLAIETELHRLAKLGNP